MITIGLVANVYNETNALPGWLETHLPFFDDVRVLHAGPQGEYSNDGTIELLEKWKIPTEFCAIDEGFGVVRTKAIRMSPCDYVMILDADERFYYLHRLMSCEGVSTPHSEVDRILQTYDFRDLSSRLPNWNEVDKLGKDLIVKNHAVYDQGEYLKLLLADEPDVLVTIRRHWHDMSFKRPTQNWHTDPDYQMRVVKNNEKIYFSQDVRMHERLVGYDKTICSHLSYGPYFDHFHFTFKRLEQSQRSHDVHIYDAIHSGNKPPTLDQFRPKVTFTNARTNQSP